jgi:hypothetical protein
MTRMALDVFPGQRQLAVSCLSVLHDYADCARVACSRRVSGRRGCDWAVGEALLFSPSAHSVAVVFARPGASRVRGEASGAEAHGMSAPRKRRTVALPVGIALGVWKS